MSWSRYAQRWRWNTSWKNARRSCSTTARRNCSTAKRRSFLDKAKFFQPTQTNPQNQSVIDQGNVLTNTKCLIKARDQGEIFSRRTLFFRSIQGNLISRLAWLELRQICLEKSELSKLTIDQGNLINMKSHYEQPLNYIVKLRRSTPTMS